MSTPLGEEFVKIRPDATTFRAELQAQIAAAMTGVQGQVAQAQAQMRRTGAAAAAAATPTGIVLPTNIRSMTLAEVQQATATEKAGKAAAATKTQIAGLSAASLKTTQTVKDMQRSVASAETAVGRYSRGMLAATAASTGFFRAVSFASGAFLIGATIGASIAAAVQEFTQMTAVGAQTVQLIKTTGAAANVTADEIDALSQQVLHLTGVDDELVKQGANVLLTFRAIRNEAGKGNDVFNRAVKAAADIAAVFRTDLRGSAVQLGKALQDPERGVTALRRSGITLTQGQRDLIKELVRSGAVLTAQKVILGEVERQVGGTAEAIGQTLPGRLRILREESLNSLSELVKRLTESATAAELANSAAKGLSQTWGAVRTVMQTVGPRLVGVAQGFARITEAVGGFGVLLAGIAAYKGITIAAGVATRATALYATASAATARVALTEAVAINAVTLELQQQAAAEVTAARAAQASMTAMTALAGVFAVGAAASGQYEVAALAAGLAIAGVVTKARAAIVAMNAAGIAVTRFGVAMAAFGGPVGLIALGAGAAALGLFALSRAFRHSAGSTGQAKAALDGLNESLAETQRLRTAIGTAREDIGLGRFNVRAAERDLQRAEERLAATRAEPGSIRFRFLEDQVRVARQNVTQVTDRLRRAEIALNVARAKNRINEQGQPELARQRLAAIQGNIAAITAQVTTSGSRGAQAQELAVRRLIDVYGNLAEKEKGAAREASSAIAVILQTLNRIPTQRELEIVVRFTQQGKSAKDILAELGVIPRLGADIEALRAEEAAAAGINANLRERNAMLTGELKAQKTKLGLITEERAKRAEIRRSAQLELAAAQDAVESAREGRNAAIEGLADARRGLADARQNLIDSARDAGRAVWEARRSLGDAQRALSDAVRESARAVADARQTLLETVRQSEESVRNAIRSAREETNTAIQDAKGNLLDLNRSIAESIAKFLEKTGGQSDKMSARMRALRQQIIRGGGGPETLRAAQEVQFNLQQQEPTLDTDKIKRRFDDLTDSFVRGRINLGQYDKRFKALTAGIDITKFREMFGTAAANEFMDMIRTSRRQAVLIKEAPQKTGAAIAQKLVNPLRVIAKGTQAIADARRQATADIKSSAVALSDALRQQTTNITNAQRGVKDAERDLKLAVEQQKKTISGAQRSISDAVHNVSRAERDIGKANRQLIAAERRFRQAEHKERQANTKALKENAKWTRQNALVTAARNALEKARQDQKKKPTGPNTQIADLLRTGGPAL